MNDIHIVIDSEIGGAFNAEVYVELEVEDESEAIGEVDVGVGVVSAIDLELGSFCSTCTIDSIDDGIGDVMALGLGDDVSLEGEDGAYDGPKLESLEGCIEAI